MPKTPSTRRTISTTHLRQHMARNDRHVAERERDERFHAKVAAEVRDPRNQIETPAVVVGRLKRTAMVPSTLSVPCDQHEAEVNAYCFPHANGVCAERVKRRVATR